MRGFRGRQPSREKSDYRRGYEKGLAHMLITFIVFVLGFRAVEWALENPVVQIVSDWATTPTFAPIEVLGWVLVLVVLYLALLPLTMLIGRYA